MHRQRYRPYWYKKEDGDKSKCKPQIGRRPFMLLYTPGSRAKKKTRKNWKQVIRNYLVCRFCRVAFDDVKDFMVHETDHMKLKRRPVSHCSICCIDLSWSYKLGHHIPTGRHRDNLKKFYRMIRSSKTEPDTFWSVWRKAVGNPSHLVLSSEHIATVDDASNPVATVSTVPPPVVKAIPNPPPSVSSVPLPSVSSVPLPSVSSVPLPSVSSVTGTDLVTCDRCGSRMQRKSVSKHNRNSICGRNHQKALQQQEIERRQQKEIGQWQHTYGHPQQTEQLQHQVFNCSTCGAGFDEEYHLNLHQLAHTRDKLYSFSCSTCGANFARRELLATHKRIHDIETPFPCDHCSNRFRKSEDLADHMREQHSDVKPCVCKECSACFSDQIKLEKHIELVHKVTQQSSSTEDETVGSFGCVYCSDTFKDRQDLIAHQKIHNPNLTGEEEPVVINKVLAAAKPCHICLKCGKEFRNSASLRGHMESHSNTISDNTDLKCKTCSKVFKTRSGLISHLKSHAAKTKKAITSKASTRPTVADSNELFSRSGVLKRILGGDGISSISGDSLSEGLSVQVSASGESNVFDPNKNVIISQGKSTNSQRKSADTTQGLTEEDSSKDKENQLVDKVSISRSNQDAGERSGRNRVRKISKCKYCVRMFLSKSKLRAHQHMHSIYRPYQCRHCFSRFKDQKVWMKHKKTHLPYPCGACEKSWVTYDGFVTHAVAAHGELKEALLAAGSPPIVGSKDIASLRGHRCVFCNRRFCREGMRLKSHLRNHLIYYKKFRFRGNKISKPSLGSGVIGDILKKTVKEGGDTEGLGETGDAVSEQQYYCGFCGEAFFSRSKATEHMAEMCPKRRKQQTTNKSGEKGNESKKSKQESMSDKNKVNSTEQPFVCSCGSSYAWEKSLKSHQKQKGHTGRGNLELSRESNKGSAEASVKSSGSDLTIDDKAVVGGKAKVDEKTKVEDKMKIGAPYTCPDCNQKFALWRLREEHIRRVHKNFTCRYCQKSFLVYQILMKHEKKHKTQGDVIKEETVKETTLKNPDNDVQEVTMENTEEALDVTEQGKMEEVQDKAVSSSTKASKADRVTMKEESKSSDDSNTSSDSNWDTGSGDDSSSESDGQLERRKQIQLKIKTEKIEDESDDESDDVMKKVDQFKCETCDRTFRRKVNLIQHARIHKAEAVESEESEEEAEKNFKCDKCERAFSRNQDLLQHMKSHTQKKYQCELCPRSFDKWLLLLRHNKRYHPGNKVIAPGSKVNTEEQSQKLTCKVCFEEFADPGKMAEHKKLHSSEKKFNCHVCNMTFIQSWDLIVHKRTHSREELRHSSTTSPITVEVSSSEADTSQLKHTCKSCGYVCKDSSHLKQHEKTHSSPNITCNFCGKVFAGNDELLSHYNKVHYAQRSEDEEDYQETGKDEKRIQGNKEESDEDWSDDNYDDLGNNSESDTDVAPAVDRYPRRGAAKRKRYIISDDDDDENLESSRYPKRPRQKKSYKDPTEQDLDLSSSDHDEDKITSSVTNQKDEPFKCSYCGIGFTLEADWSFHEYQHAQTEPFRCQFCFKLFSRRSNLVQHEKRHQGERPYSCLDCGKTFTKDTTLKLHKEKEHSKPRSRQPEKTRALTALNEPYPHNCGSCGKGFYKPSSLVKHQERCKESDEEEDSGSVKKPEPTTFVTERNAAKLARLQMAVNRTSSDEDLGGGNESNDSSQENVDEESEDVPYEPHEEEGEDEAAYQCRFCHKDFALKKQMVKHEIGVHKAKGPLECAYCDKAFWDAKKSEIHHACHKRKGDKLKDTKQEQVFDAVQIKEEKEDIVYKCRFCKKKFPLRKVLVKHEIKVHNAKGPLECTYCDKAFWFPYEKKRHEEVQHRYEKDRKSKAGGASTSEAAKKGSAALKCYACDKNFSSKDQLISHEQTHRHQQSYKCKFCLKSFQSQPDLEKHEKSHNAPKEAPSGSFGCLFCHEMFTLKSALIDHIQTHSGRESYMCPHCDLTFPTSATLQAHEKEHLQPTIYQCSHCQALFRDKEKLIKHEASHEESGYRCPDCNVTFISSQGLSNHLRSQHGKTEQEKTPSPTIIKQAKKEMLQPVVKLHSLSPKSKFSSHATPSYSQEEEGKSDAEQEIDKDREVVDAIVNPYSCNVCKQSFPSPEDLRTHVRSHTKEQPRKCQYCSKIFTRLADLRKHLRLHLRSMQNTGDSKGEFKCQMCGITCQNKPGLMSHLKTHAKSKAKPFSFHKRSAGFGLKPKFKQIVKAEPTLQKQSSGKARPQRPSVSSPERSGSSSKTVTCKYCNKTLFGRLSRHVDNVHGKDRPHKCQVCGDRFVTELDLKRHNKTHGRGGGNKPFHCEKCRESFISYANLTNHMENLHPTIKFKKIQQEIFRCKVCNKAFAQKKYLRRHELLHIKRGEYGLKRPVAGMTKTPERKPVKTGKNESPDSQSSMGSSPGSSAKSAKMADGSLYDCKYCGFQFVTLEDLKRHERTHPGEKPYSCDDCHRSYYKRSHLTLHRAKAHGPKLPSRAPEIGKSVESITIKTEPGTSSEELHRCSVCQKGFTSATNLRKHFGNKHKNRNAASNKQSQNAGGVREKPHACYKCEKRYYTNGHLKEHFERVHKEKYKPATDVELNESRYTLHSCDICDRSYYSQMHLKDHYLNAHGTEGPQSRVEKDNQTREQESERLFQCTACDKSYFRKAHLQRHYEAAHAPKENVEPTEGEQEPPSEEDDDEIAGETPQQEKALFPCPACDKKYTNKGNVKRHYESIHAPNQEAKPPSDKEDDVEPEQELYSCDVCGKSYLTDGHLQDHYSKVHGRKETLVDTSVTPKTEPPERERNYHCDMCDKSYLKKSHLNEHINRKHFGVKREPSQTTQTPRRAPELHTDAKGTVSLGGSARSREEQLKELDMRKNKPVLSQHSKAKATDLSPTITKDRPNLSQSGKREREGSIEDHIHKKVKLSHFSRSGGDKRIPIEIKSSSSTKSHHISKSSFKERSHSPVAKISSVHQSRSPSIKGALGQQSHSPGTKIASEQRSHSPVTKITHGQRSHSSSIKSSGKCSNSPLAKFASGQHSDSPSLKGSSGQRSQSLLAKGTSKQRSHSPVTKVASGQRSNSPSLKGSSGQRSQSPLTKISSGQRSHSPATKISSTQHSSLVNISSPAQHRKSPSIQNSSKQRSHSPLSRTSSEQARSSPSSTKLFKPSSLSSQKKPITSHSSKDQSSTPSPQTVRSSVPSVTKTSGQQQKEAPQPSQPIYACHVCEKTFSVRSNLAAHFQKHHI